METGKKEKKKRDQNLDRHRGAMMSLPVQYFSVDVAPDRHTEGGGDMY